MDLLVRLGLMPLGRTIGSVPNRIQLEFGFVESPSASKPMLVNAVDIADSKVEVVVQIFLKAKILVGQLNQYVFVIRSDGDKFKLLRSATAIRNVNQISKATCLVPAMHAPPSFKVGTLPIKAVLPIHLEFKCSHCSKIDRRCRGSTMHRWGRNGWG